VSEPRPAGGGAGTPAKDKIGNEISASEWRKEHGANDASLTQGLDSEPTYILTDSDSNILNFGLNAVCTHLGCVVPYDTNDKKFKCPCHGSQYDGQGKVLRGPAPLSLQLVNVDVTEDDGVVVSKVCDPISSCIFANLPAIECCHQVLLCFLFCAVQGRNRLPHRREAVVAVS
jgi:cytochrome b6-f complex iron-sulfur subunit